MGKLARDENDPRVAGLGYQGRSENMNKGSSYRHDSKGEKKINTRSFVTTVVPDPQGKQSTSSAAPCLHCGAGTRHQILECRKFSALNSDEKSEICRNKGLCFGCLQQGHMKRGCPQPLKCDRCKKSHPTALHDPSRERMMPSPGAQGQQESPKQSNKQEDSQTTTKVITGCVGVKSEICASTKTTESSAPFMTIVPVVVKPKASDKGVATYAFIDNGSGAVFADMELSTKQHIRKRQTKLLLKTLNAEEIVKCDIISDPLQVGNPDGSTFVDLPDVYIRNEIPVTEDEIPTQKDLERWSHLRTIKLPSLKESVNYICIPRVTIMIGSNVPAATQPLQTKTGRLGDPYAIRTPLGWLVYSLPGKSKSTSVHFCHINNMTCVEKANERLESQLKNYIVTAPCYHPLKINGS